MPQIETWTKFPPALRDHLVERMRDREAKLQDLNRLRIWMETNPEVLEGPWFKDFGSFNCVVQQNFRRHSFVQVRPQPAQNCSLPEPGLIVRHLPPIPLKALFDLS